MTDSGFSSAASNRSSSAITHAGLLKSQISNSTTTSRPDKENVVLAAQDSLPNPSSSGSKSITQNRFIYAKNHGDNLTKDFPSMHMSPISNLAFNFRDLNASGDKVGTPRKRLSLSSTVSLDSHQLIHPSPAALSFASTVDSSQVLHDDGCFANTPSPGEQSKVATKFDHRALQERDPNICSTSATSGDETQNSFRRFNSMPASSKVRRRHRIWSDERSGKENDPNFSATNQTRSKWHGSKSSSNPLTLLDSCSPLLPTHTRRYSGFHMLSPMASSPLTEHIAATASSAPRFVTQDSATAKLRPSANTARENKRDFLDVALKNRIAKSSGVDERSSPLSHLASCSEKDPLGKEEAESSEDVPSIFPRGSKRMLETPNPSSFFTKRHKRSTTTSINSSNSVRRGMAFSSKERKAKSADAVLINSSLHKELKFSFGSKSAPAQTTSSDEDEPLSHSRLCSSNDSDVDDVVVTSPGLNQPDVDEKLLEKILSDNKRTRKMATSDGVMGGCGSVTPAGMQHLISGTLLLATAAEESDASYFTERNAKPRKLFRSPSAPLLESSRKFRPDVRRTPRIRERDIPVPLRHRKTIDLHDISDLSPAPYREEPHPSLNRSRSASEIDIMRAVDLGCSSDNLIGDFSRVCSLKTVPGKCQDLKYITPRTLIELMESETEAGNFEIIDCRYPYEHEGGHVVGANCIWEEEKLFERYLDNPGSTRAGKSKGGNNPPLLVFYCEFSSERGPRMARALRSKDRSMNRYPYLHYPEIYILRNGFKNFFFTDNTMKYCVPTSYRPMAHVDFARELRMCRIKSKTWAGERSRVALSNRSKAT